MKNYFATLLAGFLGFLFFGPLGAVAAFAAIWIGKSIQVTTRKK